VEDSSKPGEADNSSEMGISTGAMTVAIKCMAQRVQRYFFLLRKVKQHKNYIVFDGRHARAL
jgi:hypothetical protein